MAPWSDTATNFVSSGLGAVVGTTVLLALRLAEAAKRKGAWPRLGRGAWPNIGIIWTVDVVTVLIVVGSLAKVLTPWAAFLLGATVPTAVFGVRQNGGLRHAHRNFPRSVSWLVVAASGLRAQCGFGILQSQGAALYETRRPTKERVAEEIYRRSRSEDMTSGLLLAKVREYEGYAELPLTLKRELSDIQRNGSVKMSEIEMLVAISVKLIDYNVLPPLSTFLGSEISIGPASRKRDRT
jgi:hypothetical protein